MATGPSTHCTIRIAGLVDGTPTDFDGEYIIEYDPSMVGIQLVTGRPMPLFHLVTTPDIRQASRFTASEAMNLYRAVDRRNPTRADGEPNRPLTAFTVDVEPAPESPPAGMVCRPQRFALLALVGRRALDRAHRGSVTVAEFTISP